MIELQPRDEPNRELESLVHPPDRVNPDPAERYNLVVIGGGTAGLVAAAGGALLGARVALVEREYLGGDCLVTGCVPSKALLRAGQAAAAVADADRFGIPAAGTPDFPAVLRRLREVRARIGHHDSVGRFEGLGVEIFFGEARFGGADHVEVDGRRLRFRRALIATGGRPVVPPVEGLAEAGYLTNETVFNLQDRPRRLLVVGGGPIGVELAQAFARLGSDVTIVELLPRLIPNDGAEAAGILADALRRDGVRLRLATRLERVEVIRGGKRATLAADGGAGSATVEVDEILLAVGRQPNLEGLELDAAGIAADPREGIEIDDRLRTTNKRVYAAGDVVLTHKFTHTADAAARIVLANALFFGRKRVSRLVVPWCTYTDPEVAHVGDSPQQAQARGETLEALRVDHADLDRAMLDGDTAGFVELYLKPGSDRIRGATIVGAHAGELIGLVSLAIQRKIGLQRLSQVIFPYPTRGEALRRAADSYNRSRLSPRLASLLQGWFRWLRR